MKNIQYKFADTKDREEISHLLSSFKLPTEDIGQHINNFIIAEDNNKIIGCIAAELYQGHALLRSFAVDETFRKKGIGKQLYAQLISFASENGVSTIHLLTDTAEKYFQRLGFAVTDRTSAPTEIKSTHEFAVLCPSSSIYMTKNISQETKFFKSHLHKIKTELQTESKCWAVKSDKMMFTWFEVQPNKTFAKHAHESEQMTYVLHGKLFFEVDKQIFCLEKGDFISISSNKEHKVWTEKDGATAVDSWSPVNETY